MGVALCVVFLVDVRLLYLQGRSVSGSINDCREPILSFVLEDQLTRGMIVAASVLLGSFREEQERAWRGKEIRYEAYSPPSRECEE